MYTTITIKNTNTNTTLADKVLEFNKKILSQIKDKSFFDENMKDYVYYIERENNTPPSYEGKSFDAPNLAIKFPYDIDDVILNDDSDFKKYINILIRNAVVYELLRWSNAFAPLENNIYSKLVKSIGKKSEHLDGNWGFSLIKESLEETNLDLKVLLVSLFVDFSPHTKGELFLWLRLGIRLEEKNLVSQTI